jgi:hypothetical protein
VAPPAPRPAEREWKARSSWDSVALRRGRVDRFEKIGDRLRQFCFFGALGHCVDGARNVLQSIISCEGRFDKGGNIFQRPKSHIAAAREMRLGGLDDTIYN